MRHSQTPTEVLVPLILQADVALPAVAIIGEIVTLDARLKDHGGGLIKGPSFDDICHTLERYEQLAQAARTAVDAFTDNRDTLALLRVLGDIRDGLTAL